MVESSHEKSTGSPGPISGTVTTGAAPGDLRKMYRTARAENFPTSISIRIGEDQIELRKVLWRVGGEPELKGLRYGTNPHQSAAIYASEGSAITQLEWLKWGKGGPSLTNVQDGYRGMKILSHFINPAVAVMKHLNPSGVAISIDDRLTEAYIRAREADGRAAFGSVVVFNSMVTEQVASEIATTFVEVVYAPYYTANALSIFDAKKNLRVARMPVMSADSTSLPNILSLENGAIIFEEQHKTQVNQFEDIEKLTVPTKRSPTQKEYWQLLDAWHLVLEIRSNGVVFWKNGTSYGIGQGQVDRIGAIEDAIEKARRNKKRLKGSVMASDGFMPKVDNIEAVAKKGVTAIIQPGGSEEDPRVIEACDKHGIAMVFTGERAFRH